MSLIGKLKRKDIDQVNDDFSEFPLSSPATKIRRLDADFQSIIEENPFPENDEKAIVLFNPNPLHNNTPPPPPPTTLSFSLNPELIFGIKNQIVRSSETKSAESEESKKEHEGCLAVVPWFPSRISSLESRDDELEVAESMETDEMDVEENGSSNNGSMQEGHGYQFEALHHWAHQQHCILPQPPQNTSTPITFTWSE